MNEIEEIIQAILDFRNKREWQEFHNPKDLAINLSIEASELLEIFLWKKPEDDIDLQKCKEELADVFYSAFLLASTLNLDVKLIISEKLEINEKKYPVNKARGNNEKYNKL